LSIKFCSVVPDPLTSTPSFMGEANIFSYKPMTRSQQGQRSRGILLELGCRTSAGINAPLAIAQRSLASLPPRPVLRERVGVSRL
jgi:hypothetical protein